ncbi:MAG: septation regulator SpoVG [Mollicutes bacterium]|nr:septation regulator SpoVG [Mollicutes bacterium]
MEITHVDVKKIEREGSRLRGYASVRLDDCFVVNNIRIIEGDDEMFIAMPSRRRADGEYEDIAHPINQETRDYFTKEILKEYENPTVVEKEEEEIEEETEEE